MVMRVFLHMVHELRIFDQHVRDLEQFESFVHDLLAVIAALHAADVDQRHVLDLLLEDLRFVHEIEFLEGLSRHHNRCHSGYVQRRFEPPERFHVHVVCEGLIRHSAAKDCHR